MQVVLYSTVQVVQVVLYSTMHYAGVQVVLYGTVQVLPATLHNLLPRIVFNQAAK